VNDDAGPRLAPLPRERWGADERDALHAGFPQAAARLLDDGPDGMPVPNVLGTLLHHPALAGPFLSYNRVLLEKPSIEPRLRELLVLRVAARSGSSYEWAQHTRLAASVGVTPEELDSIQGDIDRDTWSPLEADLLDATDQCIDHQRIDDTTWARLAAQLDERQLVELVFVIGTYTGLAMAFNSFGLQLDPGLEPVTPLHRSE
jgi:alkylhydroperoxidase family enzyme